MKLVRFGSVGFERPGLLTRDGEIRDLSSVVGDWDPLQLSRESLAQTRALDLTAFPVVASGVRLGVPVRGIGKFIAIGMNYKDFAAETQRSAPAEPVIFTKAI